MKNTNRQKPPRIGRTAQVLLAGVGMLLTAATLLTVSLLGFAETRATLTEVRLAGALAAARLVQADLDRALGYGVPLDALPGVNDYLKNLRDRLPDLRFFAVIGAGGQRLHQSGIEAARLDELLTRRPPSPPASGMPAAGPPIRFDAGPFALVGVPLRDGGGTVLAAVEPGEITAALTEDMWAVWPFWVGCLLLPLAWTAAVARGAVTEPLARLRIAMEAAGAGTFDRLLVRRARDPIGQCLLNFNAAAAGLHARRRAAIAQTEDVFHAVFDPEVAAAAAAARDAALADLGAGLAQAPARFRDPRASDADLFAVTLAAAGILGLAQTLETANAAAAVGAAIETLSTGPAGVIAILTTAAPALTLLPAALAALLAGLGLGWRIGWRRTLTIPAAALLLAAGPGVAHLPSGNLDSMLLTLLPGAISAGAVGLAWSLAVRQRKDSGAAGGLRGGLWVMLAGSLAGAAFAWGLSDAPPIQGLGVAVLAALALAAAPTAPMRPE